MNMLDAGTDFLRLTGELQGFEKAANMPSIVLTKEEHKKFTAAWRKAIGYDKSRAAIKTSTAKKEDIFNAARDIYQDYPELLKVIEEAFK